MALGVVSTDYPDFRYDFVYRDAVHVRASFEGLVQALLVGGVLAILVLFVFLADWRSPWVVGLATPVSIVITFGLGAANRGVPDAMSSAALGAVLGALVVVVCGAVLRRPLAMVPENTMKYAVGLLLSSFGLFWVVEGLGFFGARGASLEWPGGTWALPAILFAWIVVTRATVVLLRRLAPIPETAS